MLGGVGAKGMLALLAEKRAATLAAAEAKVAPNGAEDLAQAGTSTKGSTGTPVWTTSEGPYSGNLSGNYPSPSTTVSGRAVDGVGEFGSGLGAKDTTRFVDGIKVVDQKTGQVLQGTVDFGPTLDRIKSGGSFPHRDDGSIFQNRASDLPQKPAGYYTEYVHPTPGIAGPGPQRIVVGKGGEMYYTADHYKTFIPIKK